MYNKLKLLLAFLVAFAMLPESSYAQVSPKVSVNTNPESNQNSLSPAPSLTPVPSLTAPTIPESPKGALDLPINLGQTPTRIMPISPAKIPDLPDVAIPNSSEFDNSSSEDLSEQKKEEKNNEPPLPGRISTFVYSPENIYIIRTKGSYQTNIEFELDEVIQTISLGDPVGFKVVPSSNRIFINTLQPDRYTNMTVITDRRTYQFELSSRKDLNKDITYVAKFYFPEEQKVEKTNVSFMKPQDVMATVMPPMNVPEAAPSLPVPQPVAPAPVVQAPLMNETFKPSVNMNYSYTGDFNFIPVEVFDDGRNTHFKFSSEVIPPSVYYVDSDGSEKQAVVRQENGYLVAEGVYKNLSLRRNSEVICIYNESGGV